MLASWDMRSTTTRSARLGAAGLALAMSAALVPAAPATAASVDGNISSYAYALANVFDCTEVSVPGPGVSKLFKTADKRKKAAKAGNFRIERNGVLAAKGRVQTRTTGDGTGKPGFKSVSFTAFHKVFMKDGANELCDVTATADSQSGASLDVRRAGKIRLTWKRTGAGSLADIYLADDQGNTLVSTSSTKKRGKITRQVTPGMYTVFVQFYTRIEEGNLKPGKQATRKANYRFTARFVR